VSVSTFAAETSWFEGLTLNVQVVLGELKLLDVKFLGDLINVSDIQSL
jgi:hypothetical protein